VEGSVYSFQIGNKSELHNQEGFSFYRTFPNKILVGQGSPDDYLYAVEFQKKVCITTRVA
jgi:hypothetical protein